MSFLNNLYFPSFPPNARIWIYQSSRLLSDIESQQLQEKSAAFVANWSAHKVALRAESRVISNLFLIIIADETQVGASGCSIDSSVHFVKSMESTFSISFFDRLNVAYLLNEQLFVENFKILLQKIEEGAINESISVFDNTIQSYQELQESWLKPIKDTWLGRMLKTKSLG